MRQLILDTETTGLDPRQGHRIIEIAALELVDRRPTGRHLHLYAQSGARDRCRRDRGARHDLGRPARQAALPRRRRRVLDFARGAEWIIHNAPFDVGFLDAELALCDRGPAAGSCTPSSSTRSRSRASTFPGKRNNLDALCERFGVDNAQRTLHGALLDAQLLAEVYLAMTRGQESLTIDIAAPATSAGRCGSRMGGAAAPAPRGAGAERGGARRPRRVSRCARPASRKGTASGSRSAMPRR